METLAEAVGAAVMDLGVPMVDRVDAHEELIRMVLRPPAELAPGDLVRLIEREHAIVDQIHRRHRECREGVPPERKRAEGIDHALEVDPACALDRADAVSVLIEEVAEGGTFDVGLSFLSARQCLPPEALQAFW